MIRPIIVWSNIMMYTRKCLRKYSTLLLLDCLKTEAKEIEAETSKSKYEMGPPGFEPGITGAP